MIESWVILYLTQLVKPPLPSYNNYPPYRVYRVVE